MDYLTWNRGLFLAAILIVIGGMSVVSARSLRDRVFALGVLTQGIVVVFAVSGMFHQRAELAAVAIVLMFLSVLWSLWDKDLSHVPSLDSPLPTTNCAVSGDRPVISNNHSPAPGNDHSEGAR